jgi:hypothetical protein
MRTSAFFLDRPVKPFNMGVVVGTPDSAMSDSGTPDFQSFFKLSAILWPIVGLYRLEMESGIAFTSPNNFGSQFLA